MSIVRPFIVMIVLIMVVFSLLAPLIAQEASNVSLEITGVDATDLPVAVITANVFDRQRTPINGLSAENFALQGALAQVGTITDVQNLSDDSIPFSVVLVIDTSSSMAGNPLERAKDAARAFIDNLRENDPVALYAFNTDVFLLSDFTTDQASLRAAIDSLNATGTTALYDASLEGIIRAAEAPTARRVVVLLSDGQEDRGSDIASRSTAALEAERLGVSVFTVGFGSVDQAYMQNLANASNAEFYLAPNPERVVEIFANLSTALRSQYVITLDVPVPLDGTEYPFDLVVTAPDGSAAASGVLRAPIPVPIVSVNAFADPIREPTIITAEVAADDSLTGVTFQIEGQEAAPAQTTPPYAIEIDPETLTPGAYTLNISATDENGDTGTATVPFTIAALASRIRIEPDITTLGGITEPLNIEAIIEGQTPLDAFAAFYNGEPIPPQDAGLIFRLDPQRFTPGENTLTIEVSNQGGVTTTTDFPFTVGALAPRVTIIGLSDGQVIETPTDALIESTGQVPVMAVTAFMTRGGESVEIFAASQETTLFQIDPMQFAPGEWTFTASVLLENERGADASVTVIIAALPPVIAIEGLADGEILDENRDITVSTESQTPIRDVTFAVDGADAATELTEPYTFTIDVLAYAPGDHVLTVTAVNTSGQSASQDIGFTISDTPGEFATSQALATITAEAELTATVRQATAQAQVTSAAQTAIGATESAAAAIGTEQAAQSATAQVQATGTAIAEGSQTFAAQQAATQTERAESTANALTTAQVRATLEAESTLSAQNTLDSQATLDAESTLSAQNTRDSQATLEAESTLSAQNTRDSQATLEAESTLSAQNTRDSQATFDAESTLSAQNTLDSQATLDAESTLNAQSTRDAGGTRTVSAIATATASAATAQAQATRDSATASAQAVLDATQNSLTSTAIQQATRTAVQAALLARGATSTANAEDTAVRQEMDNARTATSDAVLTGTSAARTATADTRTQLAAGTEEATANAAGTQTRQADIAAQTQTGEAATLTGQAATEQSANATLTGDARTAEAGGTQTQVAIAAAQTEPPTLEPTEPPTAVPSRTPSATPESVITADAQAASPEAPTITPTLTSVEAPTTDLISPDNLPLILVGCGILLVLLVVIYLLVTGRRRTPRR